MALVTFTDSKGVRWHAWNVERGRFASTRTDYLATEYRTGWLCFENEDASERRRLATYPDDWMTMPAQRLELLCKAAEIVPVRRDGRIAATGEFPPFQADRR